MVTMLMDIIAIV